MRMLAIILLVILLAYLHRTWFIYNSR